MGTEWMGRYRPFVQALIQHTNASVRKSAAKYELEEGIIIATQEWQVLEYVIEHEADDPIMANIAQTLGIAKSSLSKYAKRLCKMGLTCRHHINDNQKTIILRATDEGQRFYHSVVEEKMRHLYAPLFESLSSLSDETLAVVTDALTAHNLRGLPGDTQECPDMGRIGDC